MNKLRSIPNRKWRFVGEKKSQQAEDPNKDISEFKKKLHDRANKIRK